MLLWKTLLCLLSANFVASQFASPELLVDDDPDTSLQPPGAHLLMARDPSPLEDHHLIRDLLRVREVSPEILVDYDPGTSLQPPESGSDAKEPSENRRFIRGLLFTRGVCPTGYDQCADDPSRSVFSFSLSSSLRWFFLLHSHSLCRRVPVVLCVSTHGISASRNKRVEVYNVGMDHHWGDFRAPARVLDCDPLLLRRDPNFST